MPTRSADETVHELIESDPEVRAALVERFGTTDRRRIGEIVFADRDELAWLEALLHPRVRAAHAAWLAGLGSDIAAIEIPLLYETGGEQLFDAVVVVTAPEAVRAGRALVPLAGRQERLLPDEEKIARADFAYVNDGSLDELQSFVADVIATLRAGWQAGSSSSAPPP